MYIHELENWWDFRYDSQSVMKALSEIRVRQGELLGKLSVLGFDIRNTTTLSILSLDIIKSSEIEGEKLSECGVRSSLARRLGLDEGGIKQQPSRYIEGIVDMMMDATHNFETPLTSERLFGWHNALFPTGMSGLYAIDVARYRTHDMMVVSGAMGKEKVHFKAPSPERVEGEMKRFLDWVNSTDNAEPIIKAAIAHLWFITIHPFDDGNGRIARAITDMLLARSDNNKQRFYSMSDAICSNRKEYYDILEKTQHNGSDITEWILWFLSCLKVALESTERTLETTLRKHSFWEVHRGTAFNPRQTKIINMLIEGFDGNMTTGRWSRICHCSRDTALKDARDLVNKGIFTVGESGGRSTNYLLKNP